MSSKSELMNECFSKGYLSCLTQINKCTYVQSNCYICSSDNSCSSGCCVSNFCVSSDQCYSTFSEDSSPINKIKTIAIIVGSVIAFLIVACYLTCFFIARRNARIQKLLQVQNDLSKGAVAVVAIEAQNMPMNPDLNNMMALQNMNQIQQDQLWNLQPQQQQQFGFYQPMANNQITNLYPSLNPQPQFNNQMAYMYPSQIAQTELVPYQVQQNPQGVVTIQQQQPQSLTNNGLVSYL